MSNIKHAKLNITIKSFFKMWLDLTSTFHDMTKREIQVLSSLLYHHYKLSLEITNEKILWKMLFDYDTKNLIKEELDISDINLQSLLTSLRKKKIIIDNKISKRYIPELKKNTDNFKIVYDLNIKYE